MDLWVRSQDRMELRINPKLGICVWDDNEFIIVDKYDHKMGYEYTILGKYNTKERALEVLDEIQNILNPKVILNAENIQPNGNVYEENGNVFQNYSANCEIIQMSTYVYIMPKE